jgi:hypothetical protein
MLENNHSQKIYAILLRKKGTYTGSSVTQAFRNGKPSHDNGDHNTLPLGTSGSVSSLLAATLHQGNCYQLRDTYS